MKRKIFVLICVFAVVAVVHANSRIIRSRRSDDTCGVRKRSSGLIVRGQSFSRGDFPWIVALMYTKTRPPTFFCGATLISSSFVLSAAHCINPKGSHKTLLPRDVIAYFGAHDLNDYFETGRFALSPKEIFVHDKWNPRTTQYDSDLSLLEFEARSIHFNDFVQPICLWDSEIEPTVTEGIVCGWGKSEDKDKKYENEPKLVKALIQSNEQCFLDKRPLIELSSLQTFCAGLKNGSGVCFGDSGGGLFIKVDDVFYLKGIVSSSLIKDGNCDVSNNAVYTNVLKFKYWIAEITGALRKVSCTFQMMVSWCCGDLNTCVVSQAIENEEHVIGSPVDNTVEQFDVRDNDKVKHLPRLMGKKFPNLKEFGARGCGLTVIRDYYFKDMANLNVLSLYNNRISAIEPNAFRDLVSVSNVWLYQNKLETLDEKLFSAMVNLNHLRLDYNKIKVLSPTTFRIPGGKFRYVNLGSNVCIDKLYDSGDLTELERDLKDNCEQ